MLIKHLIWCHSHVIISCTVTVFHKAVYLTATPPLTSFPILIGFSTEMQTTIRCARVSRWQAAAIWSRGFKSFVSLQAPVVKRLGVVGAGQMVYILRIFLPPKLTLDDIGPRDSLCCCQSCTGPCDIDGFSAGIYR